MHGIKFGYISVTVKCKKTSRAISVPRAANKEIDTNRVSRSVSVSVNECEELRLASVRDRVCKAVARLRFV